MRAGRVYCNATQAKAWAGFPRPFGPKPAPKVRQAPRLLGPGKYEIKACSAEGAAETVALLSRAISFLSATRQLQDFVEFFVSQRHHR
jgi:hypothetical protein